MTDTLALLRAVDRLYASVVIDPSSWNDHALADWAQETAAEGLTKSQARSVRRCMRMAARLRDFWMIRRLTPP